MKIPTRGHGFERYKEEIASKKWGMLTPIKFMGHDPKSRRTRWLCRCECGKERVYRSDCLRAGRSTSCGCIRTMGSGSDSHAWIGHEQISGTRWHRMMRDAEKRDLEFALTIEFIWDLFEKQGRRCAISGLPIEFSRITKGSAATASLDRKDSSLGYTPENVWWVHKNINFMKGALPLDKFIKFCKAVCDHGVQQQHTALPTL